MQKSFLLLFFASLIISCKSPTDNNNSEIKTGRVTFWNESSYNVKVHRDSFSGPLLAEVPSGGSRKTTVDVRVSEDIRYGTTFSIEYLYRITEGFDAENGEVIASGLDFDVQINRVIEEGGDYVIQIPQPRNIEFMTAFIKLINASALPCELRYYGSTLPMNNGNFTIVPYRIGVYKLTGIPPEGELYQGYHVVTTFKSTDFPEYLIKNGNIEVFKYDGDSVTHEDTDTFIWK